MTVKTKPGLSWREQRSNERNALQAGEDGDETGGGREPLSLLTYSSSSLVWAATALTSP